MSASEAFDVRLDRVQWHTSATADVHDLELAGVDQLVGGRPSDAEDEPGLLDREQQARDAAASDDLFAELEDQLIPRRIRDPLPAAVHAQRDN